MFGDRLEEDINIDSWVKASLESRKVATEVDFIKAKPRISQVAKVFIDFYKELKQISEPNHYDQWVPRQFQLFNQAWRLPALFMELGDIMGVIEPDIIYEGEEGLLELTFGIAGKYLENKSESKKIIRNWINGKWDVIEVRKVYWDIDDTPELRKELMENILLAQKTTVEDIADELDRVVFIGTENWQYILYSILSTYAPDIVFNGRPSRGNMHTNLIGEISTAKSLILNILKSIAPKWVNVTKATEASFEGISKPKEIQAGLIEASSDGSLLIPEFKRTISKMQLLRECMDCDIIDLTKRGMTRRFKVNTSFIVGSNPKEDFFPEMGRMRDAIPFQEGILSRFDFLIPLIMSEEKNADIVKQLKLFGGGEGTDYEKMALMIKTLSEGMKTVKSVVVTDEQEKMIKDAYLRNNHKMGYRTLVILRDLETLCRLVNIIVSTNFFNRIEENGHFKAVDVDVEKAIQLWENLIYLRKQLYEMRIDKNVMYSDETIMFIMKNNGGEMTSKELYDEMMRAGVSSSMRSCQRRIKALVEGKILVSQRKGEDGKYYITIREQHAKTPT